MAQVSPFRGWRYNPGVVGDIASVLCPPYDLITPQIQESLKSRNPLNVIHLEAGEGLDWTALDAGRYSGTAGLFRQWAGQGALQQDAEPSLYLLRHGFTLGGQPYSRLGLTAGVGLEDYASRQVLPHEFTEAPAIRDRVQLMQAVQANVSPIMALYRDAGGELTPLFQRVMQSPPVVDTQDEYGSAMTLWRISDPDETAAIGRFFAGRPVYLADGHHRYEASRQYQLQRHQADAAASAPSQSLNYVMMTLIAFDDPGLVVLPYHRSLSGLSAGQLAEIRQRLDDLFIPTVQGPASAEWLVDALTQAGADEPMLATLEPAGDGNGLSARILTLRQPPPPEWGPLAVSEGWILEEQILRPVLGEATLQHLGFLHDADEAAAGVAEGRLQMALLLKPFPLDAFEEIVGTGQRLPRKSTFFYPKLPTGLVINRLDGEL